MIDFRYHVVSLVAVFIALAVGIVLGAGPLREGISDTLEGEVSQLRTERTELRADLEDARARAQDKDGALGVLNDRVVAGTLTGARVAVVLLPGADRNQSARVADGIQTAGGEVVLQVDVDSSLEALEGPEGRSALVEELSGQLDLGEVRERGGDQAAPDDQGPGLGPVLGSALLGADPAGPTGAWLAVLDRLEEEGYVDLMWRGDAQASVLDRQPPEAVLILDGQLPTDDEGVPTRAALAALTEREGIVDRLVQDGAAVVVAGAGGETRALEPAERTSPLVALVREDRDLRAEASTVDNLESAAGQLSAVLALAWELDGQEGHYGQAGGVEAPVPAPPPVRFGTPTVPPGDEAEATEPVPAPGTGADDASDGVPDDAPVAAPDSAPGAAPDDASDEAPGDAQEGASGPAGPSGAGSDDAAGPAP